jgi:DNA-binding NarL/FixJ family response regulator
MRASPFRAGSSVHRTMTVAHVRPLSDVARPGELRVLIALEHVLFRESVRSALEREPDLSVVVALDSCSSIVDEAARVRPNVAIIDAALGGGNVIDTVRTLRAQPHAPAVVCVGVGADHRFVVQAVRAGMNGYVSRNSPVTELMSAVRAVDRGEMAIPRRMLAGVVQRLLGSDDIREDALERISRLTHRERRVLALLSKGATNGTVASAMFISPLTARTHIQNVLTKLGVHSRLEAAMFVAQNDIVQELERGPR